MTLQDLVDIVREKGFTMDATIEAEVGHPYIYIEEKGKGLEIDLDYGRVDKYER